SGGEPGRQQARQATLARVGPPHFCTKRTSANLLWTHRPVHPPATASASRALATVGVVRLSSGGKAVPRWGWGGLVAECLALLAWGWSEQVGNVPLGGGERGLALAHLLLLAVVLALAMAGGDWGP